MLSERTGERGPLTEALEISQTAAAADGHPWRTVTLINLGTVLCQLTEHTGDAEPLAEAVRCFEQAAGHTSASSALRIEACLRLTGVPGYVEQAPAAALAAVEAAVVLLPQAATGRREASSSLHHYNLSRA